MPIHALHLFGMQVRTWSLVGELPFLFFIVALYAGGRRQGWPWRAALVTTAAFVAGLGIGTALLPSVLGAVGGAVSVWYLAQRALGLRRPPTTVLALGLVALIAVGRWGCLLNGCCFGTITDLPWGVHYAAGSSAHFLHGALGLLGDGARQSLLVHPYPAYESLGLVLWLPFACWLGRRLRSKGALLAFTAAFDLGLRGFIDGTRAMVNVWWALLGTWHGLNLFQWALLGAAASLLLFGVLCELRARRAQKASEERAPALVSLSRLWLVYLGLVALGWASDRGQTAFVHRALLLALAACVPALAIPQRIALCLRARSWLGHAVASTLVLALGVRMETRAHAVGPDPIFPAPTKDRGRAQHRTWLYDVDQRRGVMVRVGSDGEDDWKLRLREDMLALPSLAVQAKALAYTPVQERSLRQDVSGPGTGLASPKTVTDDPREAARPERRSRTWVGGAYYGGVHSSSEKITTTSSNSSSDSCSGTTHTTTITHNREALGGWGQVEQELVRGANASIWIGGRAGAGRESQRDTVESSDSTQRPDSTSAYYSAYYLNLWGEYETPAFALGLAVLGTRDREGTATLYPGFHLRAGAPRFSFDAGFADRMSFLSPQSGHLGFSIPIRRGADINTLDDVFARLFIGAFFFPGVDMHHFDASGGFGMEFFITPRAAFGFNAAFDTGQLFGGMHLRLAVAQ